jgi:hypothetical protein
VEVSDISQTMADVKYGLGEIISRVSAYTEQLTDNMI